MSKALRPLLGADLDGRLVEQRRVHLRGDEAFPDQRIDLQFVFAEFSLRESGVRATDVGRMASWASWAAFFVL